MAIGWSCDGAVQEQIDATLVSDTTRRYADNRANSLGQANVQTTNRSTAIKGETNAWRDNLLANIVLRNRGNSNFTWCRDQFRIGKIHTWSRF